MIPDFIDTEGYKYTFEIVDRPFLLEIGNPNPLGKMLTVYVSKPNSLELKAIINLRNYMTELEFLNNEVIIFLSKVFKNKAFL